MLRDIVARGASSFNIRVVCIVAAPPALKTLSEQFPGAQCSSALRTWFFFVSHMGVLPVPAAAHALTPSRNSLLSGTGACRVALLSAVGLQVLTPEGHRIPDPFHLSNSMRTVLAALFRHVIDDVTNGPIQAPQQEGCSPYRN